MLRIKFHRRTYKKTTYLSISVLFLCFGFAIANTIWALYMESFGLSTSQIGFISAAFVIVSLLTSLYSTPILEKISGNKILITSLISLIVSYLLIAFYKNLWFFIFISAIITIVLILRMDSFDIIFRDEANTQTLNEEEGLMYSLMNVGWVIGPLIAGFVYALYDSKGVFIATSIFLTISLIIILNTKTSNHIKKRQKIDKNIFKNLKDYFKNKNLRYSYLLTSGIQIWWGFLFVYVPLFIIEAQKGEEIISIFLTLIMIPLVMFEYTIGKISKKFGFKIFLTLGFFALGTISLICFFINSINITLTLLIIGSFAMALLEPLQDSFFFSHVKTNDEEKYYPIFATATDVGAFIGKIFVAGILLFLSNNYAYLTISILMFIIAFSFLKLKEKPRLMEKKII